MPVPHTIAWRGAVSGSPAAVETAPAVRHNSGAVEPVSPSACNERDGERRAHRQGRMLRGCGRSARASTESTAVGRGEAGGEPAPVHVLVVQLDRGDVGAERRQGVGGPGCAREIGVSGWQHQQPPAGERDHRGVGEAVPT